MTSHSDGLKGPRFVRYFSSIIEALKALGGSARPAEVTDWVAASLGVSDDERSELTSTGVVRFDNAVAWARYYLAKAAIIDASKRGVWTLTEKGRTMPALSHGEAYAIFKVRAAALPAGARQQRVDRVREAAVVVGDRRAARRRGRGPRGRARKARQAASSSLVKMSSPRISR